MSKLRKATKRITAVAASAALVASAVFGAGLSNYPQNFVKDGKFDGKVVVGSTAATIDSTSAASIIADLQAEFSGESEKVKLTYKKSGTGGEEVLIADSGKVLKLGKTLLTARSNSFDDRDLDLLEDGTLRVGSSNKDYNQEIKVLAGSFEHTLRDKLEDEMSQKLYFGKEEIMTYKVAFTSSIDNADFDDVKLLGKKMTILGKEYTVGGVTNGSNPELRLLGGANTVSLGESESTSVTIDGKSYEIKVIAVSEGTPDKVLLSVNGETKSVEEYESELIGGVRVVVTDLVSSSRDSVKGYAEVVIGGSEIILGHTDEVVINDEDISDVFEDYKVEVDFQGTLGTNIDGFTLTYSWLNNNGFVLNKGEVFEDKVFNGFGIKFDGTNSVDYTTTTITATSDSLALETTLTDGTVFNRDIAYVDEYDTDEAYMRMVGSSDDVPMFLNDVEFDITEGTLGSVLLATVAAPTTPIVIADYNLVDTTEYFVYRNSDGTDAYDSATDKILFVGTGEEIEEVFRLSNATTNVYVSGILSDAADSGLVFLAGDEDTQYLYEVNKFKVDSTAQDNVADDEYSFKDLISEKQTSDIRVGPFAEQTAIKSKLTDVATFVTDKDNGVSWITEITTDDNYGKLALNGEGLLEFDLNVLDLPAIDGLIKFSYDDGDLRLDDDNDDGTFEFKVSFDDGVTIDWKSGGTNVPSGAKNQISTSNKDVREAVDAYGTIVRYDTDKKDEVTIKIPSKQVEAKAYLVAGAGSSETKTMTVDADKLAEAKADLKADGYTIVKEETMTAEAVEFDVTSAVLDSAVSTSSNMIVVGGPAVNAIARDLLGIEEYTISQAGVKEGEGVIKYYASENTVLVYGYDGADTAAAVSRLNDGSLSGEEVKVN